MPSLRGSGSGSENDKPRQGPPAKRSASRRKRVSVKDKKGSKKATADAEPIALATVHEHFLKLLREEAKTLNDPLLLYLYEMVIYRTKVWDNEN
jgi:hypothetical protein